MKDFIEALISRQDLSDVEMETAFDAIMSGRANDVQIASFLVALRAKGEKPSEIASAVRIMRDKALKVAVDFDVVDTCGTGGDGAVEAIGLDIAGGHQAVNQHGEDGGGKGAQGHGEEQLHECEAVAANNRGGPGHANHRGLSRR